MNFDRITDSVDTNLLNETHIVVVGAGGAYNFILNLARTGIGKLTVLDFDTVDDTNLVRQGYTQNDIGKHKVNALEDTIKAINPDVDYTGITEDFRFMSEEQLDEIFKPADMFLFLTDSFFAQSFGNTLALKYNKPSLWAGWYVRSRTAEVFFQIPNYTPACFRCAVSSRYKSYSLGLTDGNLPIRSVCNTIFHSELLDSYIGLLTLGILHREHPDTDLESVRFFKGLLNEDGTLDYNFFHLKVHPEGGNPLFDRLYDPIGKQAQNFIACWQKVEPELAPKYEEDCPDCGGMLLQQVTNKQEE